MTDKTVEEAEREFAGCGYGTFKTAVGEAVAAKFKPIREEYARYLADKAYIAEVAKAGAEKAARARRRRRGSLTALFPKSNARWDWSLLTSEVLMPVSTCAGSMR